MDVIKIENLTKTYGKARGVKNVNITIKKGEVYGFIGPNGAGKSTTIKCIMNLINKNEGSIFIDDEIVSKKNFKIKQHIGYLPSEIHLYDDLTVKKMLDYSSKFYKIDCTKRIEELVKKLDIDLTKKIDELSLGNLKKVGIVLSLMHSPKLVIMDEATSGLDPLMQEIFYEILKEEKLKGTTIFFSSHNLNELKRICDKVAIIKEGEIICVEDIKKMSKSNFFKIVINSDKMEEIKKELRGQIVEESLEGIKLIYTDSINKLLKILGKYKLDKLLIEEPDIEEIFMHYYK